MASGLRLVFSGNMVVSMRPYKAADIERVRGITRPYIATHGEPVAWVCHIKRNAPLTPGPKRFVCLGYSRLTRA